MFRNVDVSSKKSKIVLGAVVGCCVVILIIILSVVLSKSKPQAHDLQAKDRIECPGFKNEADCKAHGCEYELVKKGPSCYMKKDAFGFNLVSVAEKPEGRVYTLANRTANTPYGPSFSTVIVDISYINEEVVRVKFKDGQNDRYEVPAQKDFPLLQGEKHMDPDSMKYIVKATDKSNIFSFKIIRKEDNSVLWDTSIGGLVLSDKFLQISSYLPSTNIYGLGEHTHETLRHDLDYKTWPMFARDRFPEGGPINLYGVHPYYTCLEKNSSSHGVLLLNSNAMDVTLLPAPGITFRTIGGVIDLFFIVGNNDPEYLSELYTSLVGKATIPPYWSLGFQLSRYGYNSLENLKNAVERTRDAGIAQDVQFLDIDHMEGNRDFTYDSKRFNGLIEYINKTRDAYGLKWIIILDPAIEAVKDYSVYESGLQNDVFIKRSPVWKEDMFPEELRNNNVTYGKVWPETHVAFPNFLDDKAKNWWINTIVDYHKKLPFDGLWIDMNEPSNFGTNEDKPFYCENKPKCWSLKCPNSPYDDPPYNPLKESGSERISKMTLCMESIHSSETKNYRHYDVHSIYGWSQSQPTLEAAEKAVSGRSLVISRSTYPSSGRYTGHWLGDNKSTWDDLRRSVIGMMEFNIFGIPYIGADVCGFVKDTTPELCMRWMQLGAFYPFYRNHNGMGQKEQDPAVLGDAVKEASRRAVQRRYTLNPYLYTLFYYAHVWGNTVVRPLFHEFPRDENTWNNGEQFMWGKFLLISPILREGEKSVRMYLPDTEWWDFKYTESRQESRTGEYIIKNVEDDIPVHVRGGCILPTEDYKLKTSNADPPKNFTFYVFPAKDEATGAIYVDGLNSIKPIENKDYEFYQLGYKNCSIEIKKEEPYHGTKSFNGSIDTIHVFKVKAAKNVFIGSESLTTFSLKSDTNVLTININRKIEDIKEKITWEDEDKKCQMLP